MQTFACHAIHCHYCCAQASPTFRQPAVYPKQNNAALTALMSSLRTHDPFGGLDQLSFLA
jgi:hypothetical protein